MMKKTNKDSLISGKWSTITIFVSAIIIFMFFPLLTEMFATELREISAVISERILTIIGIEATRSGTILSLKNMVFDIVPACDGSSMLRILFILSIILSCMKTRLSIAKKTLSLILSIPIALFFNGVRVSLLVIVSLAKGYAVTEGFLHVMIGVFCFILAALAMIALLDLLSSRSEEKSSEKNNPRTTEILVFSLIILVLVHSTLIFSCLLNWKGTVYNINDIYGYVFFIPAAVLYIIAWIRHDTNLKSAGTGLFLFSFFIILAFCSQIPGNNNYILGCTFICAIAFLGVMEKGWSFTIKTIPLFLIVFLSYPKITEFINDALSMRGFEKAFIVKIILFLIFLILYFYLCKKIQKNKHESISKKSFSTYRVAWMIILLAGIIIFKSYAIDRNSANHSISKLQINYIMKQWIGTDVSDIRVENFYGNWPILNRTYTDDAGSTIGLMVVSSQGNRKNIHTPEYCQYPLGWRVKTKSYYTFVTAKGFKITANQLLLKNGKRYRNFLYWFDNGNNTTATYYGFILTDIFQKFLGNKTNWYLYVVWNDGSFNDIKLFLKDFSR
jgi:EpsI family protein